MKVVAVRLARLVSGRNRSGTFKTRHSRSDMKVIINSNSIHQPNTRLVFFFSLFIFVCFAIALSEIKVFLPEKNGKPTRNQKQTTQKCSFINIFEMNEWKKTLCDWMNFVNNVLWWSNFGSACEWVATPNHTHTHTHTQYVATGINWRKPDRNKWMATTKDWIFASVYEKIA